MGLRYVWEKWNTESYKTYYGEKSSYSGSVNGSYYPGYSDVSVNSETGAVSGVEPIYPIDSWYLGVAGYAAVYVTTIHNNVDFPNTYRYTKVLHVRSKTNYRKGSTSYGNVSSGSSGAYPGNSYSGSYWYVSKGNDTIDPSAVSYGTPHGGELLDIVVTPSASITYGGTVKYKYEISTDGGSTWSKANAGTTATTISVLIPKGVETFQARVTASDDMGFTSTTAVAGEALTVINNTAPVITCDLSALGDITAAFNVAYSVSDADGNTMTITEKIDGAVIRSYATTGGEGTLTIDADKLLRTLNGAHTLTISADDGQGGVTTHEISFTKALYACSITLAEPMEADDLIRLMAMSIARSIPDGATFQVLVCNNGYDAEPTYEDITAYVKAGYNYEFSNTVKTADKWGFNFKIIAERAPGGQGGYIESVSGGFEG